MADETLPEATVLTCPLDGCDWGHYERKVTVPSGALAEVFGCGVIAANAEHQHRQRVEDALQRHFASHKTEDYLRTITRLKRELEVTTEWQART
jgi:hypothetical protein